jgi:pimeloyl-ACP methyl ester carboxylesterase
VAKTELTEQDVVGEEHWTTKEDGVDIFMWGKSAGEPIGRKGTILFVHGSSMASQPTFDLHVDGRPFSSAMNWFAVNGYDTWSVDMEGYGRSTKTRDITCDIANGADDLAAASAYIQNLRKCGPLLVYGISSGALRAAMFAEQHPERVARLALDAFVWTGEGSPTLEQRRKNLPKFLKDKRRPINLEFVKSIFARDHPDTAEASVIEAYAEHILSLDDSIPNGTYIDMCTRLPVVDPEKISVPTIIMRGEHDGIASLDDLLKFFAKLPNPDKQFTVMTGIAHASLQQKNYLMVYDILETFFSRPEPVYLG